MQYSLALLVAILVTPAICQKGSRIINGNLVDTLRRFPHHVTIRTRLEIGGAEHICAGSIISDKWILTSLSCVQRGEQHEIVFRQRNRWDIRNSFSITVPNSAVTGYPTGYDDIALIKLPIFLIFDSEMKPIMFGNRLEKDSDFVVMPGLESHSEDYNLAYGMFALASKQTCKMTYGSDFDEFLHICTQGWRNNNQAPCEVNEGAGLVTGWPLNPRLIGIFSKISQCQEGTPAIFTDISKYRDWMISVTGQDLLINWKI